MKRKMLSYHGLIVSLICSTPSVLASEVKPIINQISEQNPTTVVPLQQLEAGQMRPKPGTVSQVTTVSELSDVQPTDWAFIALQSLVERYGCIEGYPDRTFRGQRATNRYEFAAGLNACLDKINETIGAGLSDKVSKEDLAALQRLQEEFAAELVALKGRVDGIEGKVKTLEAQQFSTTTKLSAQVFFNTTAAFSGGGAITAERGVADSAFAAPRRDPNTRVPSRVLRQNPNLTASYYLFLNLNTSFTGKDQLVTQLVVGNGSSPVNNFVSAGFFNSFGTPFLDQTGTTAPGNFTVRELFYSFPVSDAVRLSFGPRLNFYRYFDSNRFTFFLTGATSFNSNGSTLLNAVDRGSGVVLEWKINDQFRFATAYLAENTEFLNPAVFNTSSNPREGLFGGTNTLTAELTYSPSKDANFRFLYNRTNLNADANGLIGGSPGEPVPYGFLDDGFGGRLNDATSDAFVFNFDWLISKGFGVFGRYSFGSTNVAPIDITRSGGSLNVQSFQFGFGFPDLFKEGALGVVSFVVPHQFLNGKQFLLSGGGDGATQYELELSYRYPISRNISIVPAFYAIFNPNSFSFNPTVYVGNIRTQFTF